LQDNFESISPGINLRDMDMPVDFDKSKYNLLPTNALVFLKINLFVSEQITLQYIPLTFSPNFELYTVIHTPLEPPIIRIHPLTKTNLPSGRVTL